MARQQPWGQSNNSGWPGYSSEELPTIVEMLCIPGIIRVLFLFTR